MTDDRYAQEREQMVQKQLKRRGISDERVLSAFRRVKRHLFVPQNYLDLAYSDQPLPIGHNQTISQPYIVAFMTETLDLKETDRVLEVGTGSGYQAAILAQICQEVYTIEIIPELGRSARKLLADRGYTNVHVRIGDGYKGWAEHAPYDAIIVTCSPTHVPEPLGKQLAEEGCMIIPVGKKFAQELIRLRKKEGELVEESVLPVRFVPMVNDGGKRY
ncbi:MAG: protein-L-isoaspartate(D-aspartate) O-methyltransferase [Desulfobacterales bacterium]|nr:protein-L-isoaspartate(D-aspartate) O-methyltransferase [Desulfobacterales bacterium]